MVQDIKIMTFSWRQACVFFGLFLGLSYICEVSNRPKYANQRVHTGIALTVKQDFAVTVADLDNDKSDELVVTGVNHYGQDRVLVYAVKNEGLLKVMDMPVYDKNNPDMVGSSQLFGGLEVCVGDMDKDGFSDILVARKRATSGSAIAGGMDCNSPYTADVFLIKNLGQDHYVSSRLIGSFPNIRGHLLLKVFNENPDDDIPDIVVGGVSMDPNSSDKLYILNQDPNGNYSTKPADSK